MHALHQLDEFTCVISILLGFAQHLTSLGQKPRFPKSRVLEGGANVLEWDWKESDEQCCFVIEAG